MVAAKVLDLKPDIFVLNKAHRWLRGAAQLLADASNGCRDVEELACEVSRLASVTKIVAYEYQEEGKMLDLPKREFIRKATNAAHDAGCAFCLMVACEAALESNYGTSGLAISDNNLFGMKQHRHPLYGTAMLPTNEFINGEWERVEAAFVQYPDWAACFADRLATLKALQHAYPHYAEALNAQSAEDYIIAVSKTWSTDPGRANKILAIYNEYGACSGA